MRARALLALAAVAATLAAGPSAATPPADGPADPECGYVEMADPRGGAGSRLMVIDGGPVVAVDDDGQPLSGTLTCTVQVAGNRHSDPAAVSAAGSGTGVVTVVGTVSYARPDPEYAYLCTRFAYDGGPTYYWTARTSDDVGHWSTDPDAVCEYRSYGEEDPLDPRWVDQAACPGLAGLRDESVPGLLDVDETGDVALAGTPFWDCPPYAQGDRR